MAAKTQTPTVGRSVHFTDIVRTYDADGKPQGTPTVHAATIAAVNGDTVNLSVVNPDGTTAPRLSVSLTEEEAGTPGAVGRWCWPKLV